MFDILNGDSEGSIEWKPSDLCGFSKRVRDLWIRAVLQKKLQ
jgi:hypothetical protein